MKKSFYVLTLAALSFPALAQDPAPVEQPVIVAQEAPATEQPATETPVQQQMPEFAEIEQTTVATEEAVGQGEVVLHEGEVSTELAGTVEAGTAARGSLSRRFTIGAGIAAGALVYAVVSNNDDGNGGSGKPTGPTGTK